MISENSDHPILSKELRRVKLHSRRRIIIKHQTAGYNIKTMNSIFCLSFSLIVKNKEFFC